jgi:hypothetical protein
MFCGGAFLSLVDGCGKRCFVVSIVGNALADWELWSCFGLSMLCCEKKA